MLESRHVIGLFMLMLLFSGVFFTLGYVMGRNQYDGEVRAVRIPQTFTGLCPFTLWLPSGSKWKPSPIRLTTASVMMILRPRSLVSPSTRAATFTASPIAE